jgi:hypothetical protein
MTLADLHSFPCLSQDALKFFDFFEKFSLDNDSSKEFRRVQWSALDTNGTNHASLAETTRWIKTSLINLSKNRDEGERLYHLFYPCYIRAFADVADAGPAKKIKGMSKDTTEDDFIQKGEFRLLAAYLCIYVLMQDTFSLLDGSRTPGETSTTPAHHAHTASVFRSDKKAPIDNTNGDRRVTPEEWIGRYLSLGNTPFIGLNNVLQTATPESAISAFQEMDADGKGAVLLNEYCAWIKGKEIEADTPFGRLLRIGEPSIQFDLDAIMNPTAPR